ncbi:MAG: D-glycero-beta-D-manno-heptose-7-phosphate kinase [Candidatus Zixiibacteriota bacterium]
MSLSRKRIQQLTAAIGHARVLILGDIMLDEYLFGSVARISPEAPVPVVDIESTRQLLGGAANVAANIRALGDKPILLGVVGHDRAADQLRSLMRERGMATDYLVEDRSRQTTIKTRIMAHSQQVVRADRETRHDLDPSAEREIMARFEKAARTVSAVIISDYGKGMITLSLLQSVVEYCLKKKIFVAVDPKENRFHHYRRVSLITPNHHEAGFAFGRRILNMDDLLAVGQGLLDKLEAEAILITRGPQGMSLFRRGHPPTHIPTFARHVYDVTGAGDTVIAVYVSAVAAGADPVEAAIVSNAGAGVTVAEVGTASVTVAQLREELEHHLNSGRLAEAKPTLKSKGRKS